MKIFWLLLSGLLLIIAGTAWASKPFNFANSANATAKAAGEIARYKELADRGDASAQYNLGVIYHNGYGVKPDDAAAMMWYRKAAEQSHARAESDLGLLYLSGQGVSQDYSEAAKWLTKAAQQGDSIAQANLGAMYGKGEGVPQNDRLAIEWSQKAADQGNAKAKENLAVLKQSAGNKISYTIGYLVGSYWPILLIVGVLIAGLWSTFARGRPKEVNGSRW